MVPTPPPVLSWFVNSHRQLGWAGYTITKRNTNFLPHVRVLENYPCLHENVLKWGLFWDRFFSCSHSSTWRWVSWTAPRTVSSDHCRQRPSGLVHHLRPGEVRCVGGEWVELCCCWFHRGRYQLKYRFHNFSFHLNSTNQGTIIFLLGFLGLITACSKSYSWSYCYSIIILVFIIIQCLLAILTVLFRWEISLRISVLFYIFKFQIRSWASCYFRDEADYEVMISLEGRRNHILWFWYLYVEMWIFSY